MDGRPVVNSQLEAMVSKSGQRIYPRVQMPLVVEIDGVRHAAADWSLGGFGLSGSAPAGDLGDVFKCRLIFAFPYFESVMTVTAKVVRADGGKACGFQFVDMTADRAEVLSYIVDNHLSGDLVALPGMLEQGAPARIAFSGEATRRLRVFSSALRLAAVLAVAVAVAVFGGFSIVSTFLTVRSEYASVASGRTLARAPQAGFVQGVAFATGGHVSRGQVLFEVQPPMKPQEVATLEQDIAATENRIKLQTQELGDVEKAFAAWTERLGIETAASERRVHLIGAEVKARQRFYDRRAGLAVSGRTSAAQVDEAEVDLRTAETALAGEQATLERLRQEQKLAKSGLYVGDTRATRRTPGDIRRAISESEAQLASRQAALRAQQEQFVVRSPCDCVVEAQGAKIGEYVERGATVYTLGDSRGEGSEVDVLMPVDKVRFLRVGMPAQVLLSDRSEEVVGQVTQVNFNPRNTGRTGLPDQLRALSRFALVTVTLPAGGVPPVSGMPAIVTMRIAPGDLLFYLTGFNWFVSETAVPSAVGRIGA